MAIYDDKNPIFIKDLEYRGVVVKIYRTHKGAIHCGEDHHPDDLECRRCKEPLRPVICYIACVRSNVIAEGATVKQAEDRIKAIIDHAANRNNRDRDEDDEDKDDKSDKDADPTEETEEPPEEEDEDEDMPDPKRGGVTPQMEKMMKLGWPARLKALAKECRPKKKKPAGPKR